MGIAPVGSGGSFLTKRGGEGIMLERRGGGLVADAGGVLEAGGRLV
jgi:hypothetical protein